MIKVSKYNARSYTCAVLELMDEQIIDPRILAQDLLGWLSESEVKDFCNRYLRDEDNEPLIECR